MSDFHLTRVSFNFTARCNMGCKFCYIPFDGVEADPVRWLSVMRRVAELGATQVSFGGGDPFAYPTFVDFLEQVRQDVPTVSFVHVDTNGLGLRAVDYDRVVSTVDLLGLPIDGANEATHADIRLSRSSFRASTTHLAALHRRMGTKVSTVVTARNVEQLIGIAGLISRTPPKIWALYQFWAVGPIAAANASEFELNSTAYSTAVARVRDAYDFCLIEDGSVASRSGSYFFVTQTGRCYAVTASKPDQYVELGDVFDRGILERWAKVVDPNLNRDRMRRRLTVLRSTV